MLYLRKNKKAIKSILKMILDKEFESEMEHDINERAFLAGIAEGLTIAISVISPKDVPFLSPIGITLYDEFEPRMLFGEEQREFADRYKELMRERSFDLENTNAYVNTDGGLFYEEI